MVRLKEARGRWILAATVAGSSMAMLDATVVNVALPWISKSFHASLAELQWTVNGYTLTLAGLILLGGALGDRYGRRRVFVVGVTWFALASALCGLAPTIGTLIAARALQGVGGALLTPGALAIIQSSFAEEDRPRAVGAWSGLGGVAGAVGPFVGGGLISAAGWRWAFLLNVPVGAVVLLIALRHVPESRDETIGAHRAGHLDFDVLGALLGAAALAGITYTLTEATHGAGPLMIATGVAGVAAGCGFVLVERRRSHGGGTAAMLPVQVFSSRQFTAVNIVTLLVYGGMGIQFFMLVLHLQTVSGYSAIEAGTALLPVTIIMLLLSARVGGLAQRIGPRRPMTAGLAIATIGMLMTLRIGPHASYLLDVIPATTVFGLGLSLVVAPLTATVLATADPRHAGVASGINNAVARAGSLLTVAAVPAAGFDNAMIVAAAMLGAGAALTVLTIRDDALAPAPAPECTFNCGVGAPPLEPGTVDARSA